MTLLSRFDTPGGLRDFPEGSEFYDIWHHFINDMLGTAAIPGSGNIGEFYNQHVTEVNFVGDKLMVWMGFPRKLIIGHRDNRQQAFALGDTRGATETDTQVEYLEWHVTKAGDKIKKVTFVTETKEYWEEIFKFDPERVLRLYQELVSPLVVMDDLVIGGDYNPLNKWNTSDGIVHYITTSPPNTLDAAIGLAKRAVTLTGPQHAEDNYEFAMRRFGSAIESADPRVQTDVNMLARNRFSVTAREPIGLYLAGWDDTGWTKPDGSPVGNYWRIVRGRPGAVLRLEYEVPASEGFFVSDIKIGGRPIQYGGHLAEHVTVMIGGMAGKRPA